MTRLTTYLVAITAGVSIAGHGIAEIDDAPGRLTPAPTQPTVTQPIEPSVTEPTPPGVTRPTAPATTEPRQSLFERDVPPVEGSVDSVAETAAGQERTAPIEHHSDPLQATPAERLKLFEALDADGDLRVQWREVAESGVDMDRRTFEDRDVDGSDDLGRGEFVGVSGADN